MSNSVTLWLYSLSDSLSVGFFRQEYRVGCHFLLQGLPMILNIKSEILTIAYSPHLFYLALGYLWLHLLPPHWMLLYPGLTAAQLGQAHLYRWDCPLAISFARNTLSWDDLVHRIKSTDSEVRLLRFEFPCYLTRASYLIFLCPSFYISKMRMIIGSPSYSNYDDKMG